MISVGLINFEKHACICNFNAFQYLLIKWREEAAEITPTS
jgi:hypothetical protein